MQPVQQEEYHRKSCRPPEVEMLQDEALAKAEGKVLLATRQTPSPRDHLAKGPLMVDFHQGTETAACVCHLGIIREEFES